MNFLSLFVFLTLAFGLRDIEFVYSKALKWLRLAEGRKSENFMIMNYQKRLILDVRKALGHCLRMAGGVNSLEQGCVDQLIHLKY